jgi:hypothetical protein
MPMFYVPKPRQFNYRPRFYDPRKERLEALKRKYAPNPEGATQEEVEYFEQRVRKLEEEGNVKHSKLTWKDMFRKRKMPKFEYKSRFLTEEGAMSEKPETATEHVQQFKEEHTRIRRRLDYHKDFHRERRRIGVVIAVVVVCGFFLYRYHDVIVSGIYNFFF